MFVRLALLVVTVPKDAERHWDVNLILFIFLLCSDIGLEYEDSELYHSFQDFYDDIVPEFKSVGRVVNIKVCCNHEPHLRGNVYVQYKR